ncbi:MAG: aminotransferase class I/II-fold pyridoxal phosphate-dependent enzyme [Gammaproteobacteria bacterium]|nr:aminotransferase class I/II-fold pyridoxal phosphate-dependent enzyme [Gammaproteobacteria bacterium]
MRNRLKQLEKVAVLLDPAAGQRKNMTVQAIDFAESFLERLPGMNAFEADGGLSNLLDQPFAEVAEDLADLLGTLDKAVNTEGINPASGGHLGYIPGGGIYPSALGDFLADVTNRYSGISYASPGAVKIEQHLVQWMTRLVGYPATSGGDLTSGGSIANLTAIIAARETMGIRSRDIENSCIYMTADTHHCVDKSIRAAGLGECQKRHVPMDIQFRMDVNALETMILQDKAAGLRPWLVTASAGTTDTGAVDSIAEIADLAEQHGLWLHVDAAYGGFFLLCEEGRQVLRGLDKAHSIVLDPHKGMFLPYGSGAVLVRDVEWLARSQRYEADYMQDANNTNGHYSPADLSLELSRPFRGLRFWLPMKLFGLAPFRAALAEKIWLARYFHEELEKLSGWEVGPYPELSVATFRFVPDRGDPNEFNERLVEAIRADGKVFISSTLIDDKFVLRLAVLHFRTHLDSVDYLLGLLQRLVLEIA